ncbi:MAG TPA: tetratricopeptide repeat protein [Steroidobacteraceae bacterium]
MNEDQTFAKIMELAEQGVTACQIELGNGYLVGASVAGRKLTQDFAEAMRLLEPAHKKGASTATFILGTMYEEGKGTPVDVAKAIEYYEIAASQGAYLPCVRLARIYAGKGIGSSQDLAARWYQKVLSFDGEVEDEGEMDEARAFLQRK